MSTETITPAPHFSPVDSALERATVKLQAQPEKISVLQTLFHSTLAQKKGEVIGIRVEDIGTFLEQYANGRIPVDLPSNGRVLTPAGTPDYYYIAGRAHHSYWADEGLERSPQIAALSFQNEINGLIADCFEDIAFKTAFMENVVPVLIPNWVQRAKEYVASYNSDAADQGYSEDLVYHQYAEALAKKLREFDNKKFSLPVLVKNIHTSSETVFNSFIGMIPDESARVEIAGFMSNVATQRGGIIIGFNQEVLQGMWINNSMIGPHFDTEDATIGHQVAIKLPQGYIDLTLSPIVAIESNGDYEDEVLAALGVK